MVSGYLSGVGLIITGSQIPKFLGVVGAASLTAAVGHPAPWVWQSAVFGLVVVAAMLLLMDTLGICWPGMDLLSLSTLL